MAAERVVEVVDVVADRRDSGGVGGVALVIDQFGLERSEEALRDGVDAPILSRGQFRHAPSEYLEDLTDDVPLEATQYIGLAETLLGSTCDIGACSRVAAHSHQRDHPECSVGIAVAAAVKSMAILSTG